ncbi:pseudouridine synthase [Lentinula raphanica]|uniref:Pseudouridine synthase n=1 Tax=Lentinula raphanica TaxID=153919 RepID=A0AA38P817_9AGAR|nr:pseudouridine synthase [Lentinula raphanica]KAJ3838038.1 pseudouridine synthase [Lentinula raphanica]KAJ3969703.1 pseudouridine synthase [Lentinula raphanica]
MSSSSSYENWSRDELIARIQALEGSNSSRRNVTPPLSTSKNTQSPSLASRAPKTRPFNEFNFASHPRRKIALKFCYSGWEYNGLAYQLKPTPLPTVEGVIFEALSRTRLIDPAAGYEGCGWEKCGRTDRGVSAAGQVISLWVRSALKEDSAEAIVGERTLSDGADDAVEEGLTPEEYPMLDDGFGSLRLNDGGEETSASSSSSAPQLNRPELNYVAILNRVLPSTIRILAWSPVSTTFSARYACKCRHYKYFFSSEHLDISKMRDAASRLLGQHDFRNLCKLDPAKQITIFDRRILRADIEPVEPSNSTASASMHVLNLVGTAFLYHQVRHIMAVLLLVGRGLEHPSVITSLLCTKEGAEQTHAGESIEVVDSKPEYQMADALPLMLWDCVYSDDDVDWRTDGHEIGSARDQSNGSSEDGRGVYHDLHSIRSRSQIYTALNQHFLDAASFFFAEPWVIGPEGVLGVKHGANVMMEVPLGGGRSRKLQQYVPLLKRKRLDPVDVVNERWRNGKGFRRDQRKMTGGENEQSETEDE